MILSDIGKLSRQASTSSAARLRQAQPPGFDRLSRQGVKGKSPAGGGIGPKHPAPTQEGRRPNKQGQRQKPGPCCVAEFRKWHQKKIREAVKKKSTKSAGPALICGRYTN
jgi:hypothetical protein